MQRIISQPYPPHSEKRSASAALLLFFGLFLALAGGWLNTRPYSLAIEISLNAPGGPYLQIFPFAGGYSEANVRQVPLQAGRQVVHRLSVQSPRLPKVVRIDPGSAVGMIELQYLGFASFSDSARLEGLRLREAMVLRNDMHWDTHGNLVASGHDPWFEVAVPPDVLAGPRAARRAGTALGIVGLVLAAGVMAMRGRRVIVQLRRMTMMMPAALWKMPAMTVAGIVVMAALGLPVEGLLHDPLRGGRYGAQLFLAALLLAAIGAALLDALRLPPRMQGSARLFLALAIGQCGLVAYLYLRSMVSAIGAPAVGSMEMGTLAVVACGWLWYRRHRTGAATGMQGLPVQLGMLAAICLVVADRELPRIVMLSSDPDTHAFLSQRILSLGFLPWSGDLVFDYPAGSAFLGASWSWLSGLDPRDTITALPLIACLTGAMLLAEAVAQRHRHPLAMPAALLTALALTIAAFLFPLFSQYAHMEGTGRQMCFVFAAAVPALWMASAPAAVRTGWALVVPCALLLLALGSLNPIGPVMPGIVMGAFWLHASLHHRHPHPAALALPLAAFALLLDPYYQGLVQGAGANPKITVTANYTALSLTELLAQWPSFYTRHAAELGKQLFWLMPQHAAPTFLLLLLPIGAVLLYLRRPRLSREALLAGAALLAATAACIGLFFTLRNDPRGYLLPGYFSFSVSQYEFILLTVLAAMASTAAVIRGFAVGWLATAAVACCVIALGMRTQQESMWTPRQAYCGSLGCASANDLAVLEMMRGVMDDMSGKKVLLPNLSLHTGNEAWVFPVAGARALPFSGSLEPAFFYYQGDPDFSSRSYQDNVCHQLDRRWLARHRIGYVFLPENRAQACISGMESLIDSERIVFQSGDAYLLELSTP
ncbi:hypothetical protein [Stenotrophomonas pictorum]|uniref:hypothetical protein n=2 Tax=Stenotrophomonas pictorum TaxID=86184 RepID=UPI000B1A649D|nr:hypothetical protein [Stenotrophomonas pictorum]